MSASTDQNPTGFSVNSNGEKTLLIIRHAKSSWDIGTQSDFERSLNDRGKRDAPMMAQRIKDRNILIDAFVASPAKRAKKTAEYFIETYDRKKEEIVFIPQLYHATTTVFFDVAQTLDDQFNTVAIFSHNPGITDFVNLLIKNVRLDNMPTCGVFAIKLKDKSWKNFSTAAKEFLFFDYPKNS